MVFLLVFVTFAVGISISSLVESRKQRALKPEVPFELAASSGFNLAPVEVSNHPELRTR